MHTRTLAELRHADSASFGGKSSTLGELIAGGIPVPPGFAVSTSAFRAFVEEAGLAGMISVEMSRMSPADVESVGAASHAISQAMRSAPIPEAVRDEVDPALRRAGRGAAGRRSLQRARRGQPGRDVRGPAGDVSLGARRRPRLRRRARLLGQPVQPAGDRYRARLSDGGEPAMGVAVQQMVDAEVSGVLFTCNPVSGDPSMVAVNASWGLGLAVVGGEVTPDDYLVSKVTREVVREHIHAKDVEYVPDRRRSRRGPDGGAAGAARGRVPRRRGDRRARRRRRSHRAVLRLAPGRRVGDRARRRARSSSSRAPSPRCTSRPVRRRRRRWRS